MTTVGLIGSGNIGGTVARLAVAAGHQVVLSNSRGPQTLAGLVADLGPLARAATPARGRGGRRHRGGVDPGQGGRQHPRGATGGQARHGHRQLLPRAGRAHPGTGQRRTDAQRVPAAAPAGRARREGFNNIYSKHLENLARPAGAADRSYLPIAGDSADAKAAVTQFLDSIGYGAVDAGHLADSWRQQPGTPVYGPPYGSFDNEKGTAAGADVIRAALAAATR